MVDYSSLFKYNPVPIWVYEIDSFHIVDVNESAINHYGFPKEEILSKTILDLSPKEEISDVLRTQDLIQNQKGNINIGVFTHLKENGEPIRMEIKVHKVKFMDKECVMMLCEDITHKEGTIQTNLEIQNLMAASLDVITSIDEEGKFIRVSGASQSLWGYSPEELVGSSYIDLVHPEDVELTNQAAADIISGKNLTTFENRYIKKNGKVAYNLWSARWDAESKIMYAIARDATEKKQKEEILIESESRFKALVQEGSDLIGILDENGLYKYVSPTTANILGIPPEEFLGRSPFEFIHPEDKERTLQSLSDIITQNRVKVEPFRFQNKDGEWRWMETILTNLMDHPSIKGIVANSRDITLIREEEKRLEQLDEKLHEILRSITDGFYALDENWNFTYFNKEAEGLLKKKSEDVLGKNMWKVFPDALGTELETNYRSVASTETSLSFEYLYPGDNRWYEINVYPSNDGIASFFKNIDAKKKASDEIKKAYLEKEQILESIGDAFFTVDNNWIVTYWNRMAEKVLFMKRDEIIGKNLWAVYDDVIDTEFYRKYHKAKKTGKIETFQEYYSTLDKWFEVMAYPSEEGLSVYFKDITLRRNTEMQILHANERFEKVTEATSDAIWDWDIVNNTFYRGDGFKELFGYEVKKMLKENEYWKDYSHPEDLPMIQKSLHSTLNNRDKDYWQMNYRIIHSSDEIKTVQDKGMVIRDNSGNAIRMVGAITDITETKKFEMELQRLNDKLRKHATELEITNDQLEQFAYIASHDLQEPLRMITSFLNQLQRKYSDHLDDKAQQYIHFATDGAQRMKQIILDLLEYSRAGRIDHKTEKINLTQLLDEYTLLRRKVIEENNAVIKINSLPEVIGQKSPLTQAVHSLLDNAIKYRKLNEPPVIEISTIENKNSWTFQVKDNGIGIDSHFFDKIFVVFQRLHNRNEYSGTGIGLSVAKRNIESWGGRIWVESIPEKGSTFYFTIPKS